MFSLSWVVAQAVLSAIVRSDGVFLRTSKTKSHATFVRAIAASRWETAIALTCLLVGIAILARGFFALGLALAILCFWQALIYGSAFVTSLSAIRSARLDARPARYRHEERPADRRALLWVPAAAGLGALAIFIALPGVATAPTVVTELNAASDRQVPLLPPAVITTPAPAAAALANLSGRSPGTNSAVTACATVSAPETVRLPAAVTGSLRSRAGWTHPDGRIRRRGGGPAGTP